MGMNLCMFILFAQNLIIVNFGTLRRDQKVFQNSNMIIYSAWVVVSQIAITWYSLIFVEMIAIACRTDVIFQDYDNHSLVTKSNDLAFFCNEELSWNKVISACQIMRFKLYANEAIHSHAWLHIHTLTKKGSWILFNCFLNSF